MPNEPLPKTTKELEAEIARLEKDLSDRGELSKAETAALVARLDKLEKALAEKPAPPPPAPSPSPAPAAEPKPRRRALLPWVEDED